MQYGIVGMAHAAHRSAAPSFGRALLAGIGAGIAAALASVGVAAAVHARIPPPEPTVGSAFLAGVLGGLVYAGWSRVVARPALALWITSLTFATAISILVAILPFPSGRDLIALPIPGLLVPLRQVAALAGIGHFSSFHFPSAYLRVAITQHYITAIVVSLLVPWWAPSRPSRGHGTKP